MLNENAKTLATYCEELEGELKLVVKESHKLSRLLENAVWDDNMTLEEKIEFTGPTRELIELIQPLMKSNNWNINGTRFDEQFLRVLDEVISIRLPKGEGHLEFVSLLDAYKHYKWEHNGD